MTRIRRVLVAVHDLTRAPRGELRKAAAVARAARATACDNALRLYGIRTS